MAYYQQVGRAGRGTDDATVVLLPAIEDRDIWAYFGSLAFPREELVRQTLEVLAGSDKPLSTAALETYVELNRNRLETMLKVLDVDGAVRRVQGGWRPPASPGSTTRTATPGSPRPGSASSRRCSPTSTPTGAACSTSATSSTTPGRRTCGRCDNCGGMTLSAAVSEAAVSEAHERLARPGVAVEPRKMWPTGAGHLGIDLKGKISGGGERGARGRPAHRPRPRPVAARPVPAR